LQQPWQRVQLVGWPPARTRGCPCVICKLCLWARRGLHDGGCESMSAASTMHTCASLCVCVSGRTGAASWAAPAVAYQACLGVWRVWRHTQEGWWSAARGSKVELVCTLGVWPCASSVHVCGCWCVRGVGSGVSCVSGWAQLDVVSFHPGVLDGLPQSGTSPHGVYCLFPPPAASSLAVVLPPSTA
jgi:hypothetical protein